MLKSLRFRIVATSILAILTALFVANRVITELFTQYATKQFELNIKNQFNQLASLVSIDLWSQQPQLVSPVGEPRWAKPLSGLYWQINASDGTVLRSRSLWDQTLAIRGSKNQSDQPLFYEISSIGQHSLLAYSKTVSLEDAQSTPFTLTVAVDRSPLDAEITLFSSEIRRYLFILALTLLMILIMQITIGLQPLEALKKAMIRLKSGKSSMIEGEYPTEFNILVKDFNTVLEQNQQIIARARAQAGNLAHAIKTPLAVIQNAVNDNNLSKEAFKELVLQQSQSAKEQVDWSLAKAKSIALNRIVTTRTPVLETIQSVVRVMDKLHSDKSLQIKITCNEPAPIFNGEAHDLQEMIGNVLDNACKWAKSIVNIKISNRVNFVEICIEDDGVGLDPAKYDSALKRGIKLDEITPGSGLGLSIVSELAELYGGKVSLNQSPIGGLSITIVLPNVFKTNALISRFSAGQTT
ncbi:MULTISPECIES: ATP-binding protein [unclassified Polynucleobacter]|uniref:ATP-binding protein n=1 Tax=unclassified Polynucleobacter TaxID=2640945 RepID=UPI0025736819|nr:MULTISPECIES: ATP-binding protein [unclassified Polynucleobacter]